MAGNINWNDTKLEAGLQKVERQLVSEMAQLWVREAQRKVSVSAGGTGKLARAVRRTRGELKGPLKKTYDNFKRRGFSDAEAKKFAADQYEKYRHSKPGEPPRKITGFGQRNIVWRMVDRALPTARAGLFLNAMYMFFLEKGFIIRRRGSKSKKGGTRVEARPWMVVTFNQTMPMFKKMVERLNGTIK